MSDDREKAMYANVDKFILLANELAKSDQSGGVGVALRFAAARYSAFEASMRTNNLSDEKAEQVETFANDFKTMLEMNIEEYIKIQSQN